MVKVKGFLVKVKVIDFPVRYEDKRYGVGDEFEMKIEHVNPKLVELVEDDIKPIIEMNKTELMSYAKENDFVVNNSMKKEDILSLIEGDSDVEVDKSYTEQE